MDFSRQEGGTVTIRIIDYEENYSTSISDNGVGFDNTVTKKKTSVGLVNTGLLSSNRHFAGSIRHFDHSIRLSSYENSRLREKSIAC